MPVLLTSLAPLVTALRGDGAAFAHAAGPQSWKAFLHPPRGPLWTARRDDDGFAVEEGDRDPPRYAFLGVRGCDLKAIGIDITEETHALAREG
jgi:hypothetical protein